MEGGDSMDGPGTEREGMSQLCLMLFEWYFKATGQCELTLKVSVHRKGVKGLVPGALGSEPVCKDNREGRAGDVRRLTEGVVTEAWGRRRLRSRCHPPCALTVFWQVTATGREAGRGSDHGYSYTHESSCFIY